MKRKFANSVAGKVAAKKEMQLRAEDLKTLSEQRADLVQKMKDMTEKAQLEQRAFTDEEDENFEKLSKDVERLDSTIAKMERARSLSLNVVSEEKKE